MPDLPIGQHEFYAGIDPGFTGAIGLMNITGSVVKVWDIPIRRTGPRNRHREYDLDKLEPVYRYLARLPLLALGIEWPTTRPGEGAERAERFGRGKGYLEAFAHLKRLSYFKIAPNLWKGRLGLPGKSSTEANRQAADLFDIYYPEYGDLIRGPRGGVRDGRCDALLIAHFLRLQTVRGTRSVVEKFGNQSDEAMLLALKGATGRKRRLRI